MREEYSNFGTRGGRPYGVAIIDEADNILIDENSKIAMLSTVTPSMENINILFISIWNKLEELDSKIIQSGKELYFND